MPRISHVAVIGILLLASCSWARGQSPAADGSAGQVDTGQSESGAPAESPRSFESTFWSYLQRAQYRNWAPAGGRTTDYFDGHSPHGPLVRLYANRATLGDLSSPPYGAILIKENFDDQKQLLAVTVMYRSQNCAPDHKDWYWIKYRPDGTLETSAADATSASATNAEQGSDQSATVADRSASCIACHRNAAGDDYIYSNDPLVD